MFTTLFDAFALLLVAAAVLGYVNHRFTKLPFAVGVMVGGLVGSLILLAIEALTGYQVTEVVVDHLLDDLNFTQVVMHGMLSFLLFAGSMHTDMDRLRKWALPILSLASVGVLISTGLIGGGAYFLFDAVGYDVPFWFCLVFGALISPSDPVAVLGIMREAGAPEDIEIKVVGESLFNDGICVVVFTVLLSIAAAGGSGAEEMTAGSVGWLLAVEVVGGVGLGLVGGYVTYLAMREVNEPNLEVLITVSLVMGLTFVAFKLHASAPLACVVAGLFLGNRGREGAMSEKTESAVDTVWGFIDEALNAALFLLIGIEVIAVVLPAGIVWAALGAIALALASRAAAVFIPMQVLERRLEFVPGTKRVLWWGGLKGGISVALALSLPEFEGRQIVVAATYLTVVFSVLVQGLTIGSVIEHLFPGSDAAQATH